MVDRGTPSRRSWVRTRWMPRSRSPSLNQLSPPQSGGGLDGVPRLVRPAPAALRVDETGERVEQAVEIGRDVEAEDLDVVADVADHRELAGREHGCESSGEACATAAAREQDDPHAGTARSARVRAPEASA